MMHDKTIVLPGGAGLVGQNLVVRLIQRGYKRIVVIDKHHHNLEIMKRLHPEVKCIEADVSKSGDWGNFFAKDSIVVMLQAQIGGLDMAAFTRNNIDSTQEILRVMRDKELTELVHISSSVVESVSVDFYSTTKRDQEKIVLKSEFNPIVLRPTLMFGWFDRKHLGWLSRFMKKIPVFPIPGSGKYMRQPLYVGDFCQIIISSIERKIPPGIYNISGHEKIDYVDIIRAMKKVIGANTWIVHIPYSVFYLLLKIWSLLDKSPPFTTQQLAALIAKDEFEVIDWPSIFQVRATPFIEAVEETFNHTSFSQVTLEF